MYNDYCVFLVGLTGCRNCYAYDRNRNVIDSSAIIIDNQLCIAKEILLECLNGM